jgi:hypothetical protein
MKKLILCISLLAISSFIKGAADKPTPTLYIVWKMGISGQILVPGRYAAPINVPFALDSAEKPTYEFCPARKCTDPIEVRFYRTAVTNDPKKKLLLQPMWHVPTRIDVQVPQICRIWDWDSKSIRGSWDDLPDGTRIVLRYSETTKVAATLKLALKVREFGLYN